MKKPTTYYLFVSALIFSSLVSSSPQGTVGGNGSIVGDEGDSSQSSSSEVQTGQINTLGEGVQTYTFSSITTLGGEVSTESQTAQASIPTLGGEILTDSIGTVGQSQQTPAPNGIPASNVQPTQFLTGEGFTIAVTFPGSSPTGTATPTASPTSVPTTISSNARAASSASASILDGSQLQGTSTSGASGSNAAATRKGLHSISVASFFLVLGSFLL
ncbi:hypothetical protein IE53DRAFT_229552 [Violaceomyces palustris]|uniref:Uncharacterized protein n=1 Tax=Violaceomyces palustris TaxID=1673888 RepID=A0ACD0NPS4_9BASI|nr:hypothetical protein IE53DRAFT_229552 [Violaceomyces palustris]